MSGRIAEAKKIIVSTHDSLYPVKGGGALRTMAVARELAQKGQKVTLIVPAGRMKALEGIPVISIGEPRKQRSQILSALKFNVRLLLKAWRHILRADIVFVHNTIAAPLMPFLKKALGFRFVLDVTDIHAEYLTHGRRTLFEKVLTPVLLAYEYFIIRSADFVIVATEAMKKLLLTKKVEVSRMEVIYDSVENGIIPSQKEPGAEMGIIHLGAIDRQHGVETLVRAVPLVVSRFPQARFFFVGGGRELPAVKALAFRMGVLPHCVFTDWLSCREARRYLKKACIGVIPRPDILPNRIITTLKIFEYWASSTAVICSPLEGIREISYNNENALWFSPDNPKDLAEKINLLLGNTELRSGLAAKGYIAAARYEARVSAGRIAQALLGV